MKITTLTLSIVLVATTAVAQLEITKNDVIVFREAGRYAGWPANYGIWSWGNEIVTGFYAGYANEKYKEEKASYPIDRDKRQVVRQARSTDGGETWTIEKPTFLDEKDDIKKATPLKEPMDFSNPNFGLIFRMEGSNEGSSTFCWTNDRAKTWNGPFEFPAFDRKAIMARTDYMVLGKNELMAFSTAGKDDGKEGWPFVTKTTDGGLTWKFVSWIGPQPKDPGSFAIMPSTVRLSDTDLFTMIRRRGMKEDGKTKWWWIEPFLSNDNGKTWTLQKEPTFDNAGNPASMIKLKDGRIVVTTGDRNPPYVIRAFISEDNAKTWSKPLVIRDGAVRWDLGYPRTVQRPDGKIVTVYYYNDKTMVDSFIAATIWEPVKKS